MKEAITSGYVGASQKLKYLSNVLKMNRYQEQRNEDPNDIDMDLPQESEEETGQGTTTMTDDNMATEDFPNDSMATDSQAETSEQPDVNESHNPDPIIEPPQSRSLSPLTSPELTENETPENIQRSRIRLRSGTLVMNKGKQ